MPIKYSYTNEEDYGYIADTPQDIAEFGSMEGRYDPTGQPAIVSWNTLEPVVEQKAAEMDKIRAAGHIVLWWKIARFFRIPIWESNQGNLGSCAGWAASTGYMTMVLYQMLLGAFRFVLINPLAMWVLTKNWSMSGGQSMTKVMLGGNQHGNFPVQNVGAYTTRLTNEKRNRIIAARGEAKLHQFGVCRLTGNGREVARKIVQCLRAGMTVAIGNNIRVSGSRIDTNGMRVAVLGGTWMHATVFDAYIVVNGTVYVHWTNSHGNRYMGKDRFDAPESGCWMTLDTLNQFCSGRFCDAFVIYQSEAPVDTDRQSFVPMTFNMKG